MVGVKASPSHWTRLVLGTKGI